MRRTEPVELVNISLTGNPRPHHVHPDDLVGTGIAGDIRWQMINGFAVALIVGITIGTYSSIYVASNILLLLNVSKGT